VWSFTANAGDALVLRSGGSDLTPWIQLFGAQGRVGGSSDVAQQQRPGQLSHRAGYQQRHLCGGRERGIRRSSGTYNLTLAQVPAAIVVSTGDEGGH